jgi:hypothetical protein
MTHEERRQKETLFNWVRFVVGTLMFAAMFYVKVYVQDFPTILFGIPGVLLGVDPNKWLRGR